MSKKAKTTPKKTSVVAGVQRLDLLAKRAFKVALWLGSAMGVIDKIVDFVRRYTDVP